MAYLSIISWRALKLIVDDGHKDAMRRVRTAVQFCHSYTSQLSADSRRLQAILRRSTNPRDLLLPLQLATSPFDGNMSPTNDKHVGLLASIRHYPTAVYFMVSDGDMNWIIILFFSSETNFVNDSVSMECVQFLHSISLVNMQWVTVVVSEHTPTLDHYLFSCICLSCFRFTRISITDVRLDCCRQLFWTISCHSLGVDRIRYMVVNCTIVIDFQYSVMCCCQRVLCLVSSIHYARHLTFLDWQSLRWLPAVW